MNTHGTTRILGPFSAVLTSLLMLACAGKSHDAPPVMKPRLYTQKATFNIAEKIQLSLVDGQAPAQDKDWVGLYEAVATPGTTTPAIWRSTLKDLGILWSWGVFTFDPTKIPAEQKSRYTGSKAYKFVLAFNDSYQVAASTESFTTVAPPSLAVSSAKIYADEAFTITLANGNNPPGSKDWIGIWPADKGPQDYIWCPYVKDLGITGANGSYTFDPAKAPGLNRSAYLPGRSYKVALLFNDSYTVEASTTFTLRPALALSNTTPAPSETFSVTLQGGNNPVGGKDWIGLYAAEDTTIKGGYLWFAYAKDLGITGADGTFTFDPSKLTAAAKAQYTSGKGFKFVLFFNDSYTIETIAPFTLK